MDSIGQRGTCRITLFCIWVFSVASSHEHSMANMNVREITETDSGQHTLSSWSHTSADAVPRHYTGTQHSQNRWQSQMAFSKAVYSFQVKEDTVPGTVVGKVEASSESLTHITYSVQEDDGENQFLLNPVSGEFLLSRSLDFETQSFYVLTVQVQLGDSQVSSVRLYFNVLDVNDHPPVFSQDTFSASLLEDTQVGTCFLSINVSDKDDGDNGKVKLRVVGGDEDAKFSIHLNGSLCLMKRLDRERHSSYNMTVVATDCVQPESLQFTSTSHVIVAVEDVNDNTPVFVSAGRVHVPEDSLLHSIITTVHAEDEDGGFNGNVWYFLNDSSNGTFSIHNTSGELYLEKVLDREEEDTLTITVTAADGGSPQRATTMNFTVHVGDTNDNDPEMSHSSYNLTVREDIPRGTSVLQVHARDRDIGPNGRVRYMLTRGGPFQVDTVRGIVTVWDQLDREKESNYMLILTAVDQGHTPRSATATINISVLDINDFVPLFTPETLIIHVKENEENQSQLPHQISALDEDLGFNSQLTYFIQEGNSDGLFSITPNGTFGILHSLDREKESLYIVTINAVDLGLPPLTGTLTVHVVVDDVNDNHPEFTEEVYNTIVSEDSPVGTVFAMITASDIDEGESGEIRYFLENTDVPFAIEEMSGELLTTNLLDRESVAIYRLTVFGTDSHPTQPLSNSVLVSVLIGDINDHWPEFLNSPYVAYVPNDAAVGSVVCAVKAADGDTEMNADLRYSLYGQSSDFFSIDSYSGTVFISRPLLGRDDIVVNVHVEDAGEPPKFDITTISVRSQNKSDFPEISVPVLSHSLSEDEPVGKLVAVITAESIRAEPVSFYLATGNFEDMFHVDQLSGALRVENSLDYENKKEFSLLIEARDAGSPPFSSFAELHINITDANDNFPQFTQEEYTCEIYENSPPSTFCDVLAVDADSGLFGTVHYDITEGNDDNLFSIEPENGLLSTTLGLDREYIAKFNLTVEAAELENPLHKDKATVVISVLDRNDNAPRFSQIFITEVPEDVSVGHTVIQVTSSDDDSDANAVINYSLFDESDDIRFYIDFITGYITVVSPLDREEQDQYILRVYANDSAWSISTDVTVVISDINDNSPVFSDPVYTVVLPETKDEEVFVLQVIATDADAGKNSEIFYDIEASNEEFWVNASSGEVYTKQPLMLYNSAAETYHFTVFAFDCGNVSLYSNATVTVRLEPLNQYGPRFLPFRPLVAVPSDLPLGAELVQITATDPDTNDSADIEYLSTGGNASGVFWIQPNTGQILLSQTLTVSENMTLTFRVVAKDQGFPSLTSQTEVTFQITGRNQYSPRFFESDVTFSVPEDLPVGSVIGKLQAEDKDNGPNGVIAYSVNQGNQYLPFSASEVSGLVTLIKELDYETESIHYFQITATDGGWFSKAAIVNVTVRVMDVNDNPPVFSSSEFITSVPENSKIGTNVLDMKAIDIDSGVNAQITYSLIAGHVNTFAIDSRNGCITTLDVFDYEQEQIFDLTVKASNADVFTLFSLAHVVIKISDVNEFIPSFAYKQFNISVLKNVPVGSPIEKITATDHDLGSEGKVFYLMFGQNKNMGFDIDQFSGEIYTTRSLRKQANSHVALKVLAKNPGVITGTNIDETLVHISVIDTNDPPMFTSALYVANVTEDSPAGTSVITVSALDQDSILDWNRIFFSIENGNTNISFSVDPSSGVISVNSPLDRERWPVYNLTVIASDNGSPSATGRTNVIVAIIDINDCAPKLTSAEARVMENHPEGTIIAKLSATDCDLPPNQGPFTFWLTNPSDAFSLSPDGILLTTQTVDRERASSYRLLIAVRDAGFPSPLSSTATFHILVDDENDNPPFPRNIFIEVKYFGSFFQGGVIGNVHPDDPDESDTFSCAIKSGPVMFTIPNGTCELWSSSFQGEATFNVTIEATDQLHFPVNNSIYVNYKGFTNASIDSCILFYVSSSSMEEFLSNKYLKFVKVLDSLFNLQASKTHVFGIKHIGNEILLLAAVKNYNGQYLSREVARSISARHRKLLEAQSNMTISHITSDPCLTSPCQNSAKCKKNIYISQEVAVLESVGVIFVSPQKEVFNCTCPAGYTGSFCEDDIDECEANPCQNKGTCVNAAGGFRCHCEDGFSGSVCSTDLDECLKVKCQNGGTCIPSEDGSHCHCQPGFEGGICEQVKDHCGSAPCAQGSCTNSATGFSCNCPFGVSGVHCDEHSYGFEELSYMEFPPLDRRMNSIHLEFATVQRNSLLIYNPGGSSNKEFFALEILDGAVRLSYNLGAGPVRLQTLKQVADGQFHSVDALRIGNASVTVYQTVAYRSKKKDGKQYLSRSICIYQVGSLDIDNCTEEDNSGFCFSMSEGSMSQRTLDVGNSKMSLGGLKTDEFLLLLLLHPVQIQTHDFVGCIQNFQVNGNQLRPSTAFSTYNIFNRCPRSAVSACHSLPCMNGGVCHDLWFDYFCECKSLYTGRSCATELSADLVLQLNGNGYIEFVVKDRVKRDHLLKDSVSKSKDGNTKDQTVINVKFKTEDDGVLFFVLGKTGFIMLAIRNKKAVYISKDVQSGQLSEATVDHPVADRKWHVLSLFSNDQNSSLTLDGKPVLNSSDHCMDLTPVNVEKILLGAGPPGETNLQQLQGFIGCVQYFNVSGYTLPISGHSMMVDVWSSLALTQSNCSSPSVCIPSPPNEKNRSCICLYNVSEHVCDVCTSTAQSRGQCSAVQSSEPLWLIAVVLPLITVTLLVVGVFVCLFKLRPWHAKSQRQSVPPKTEQGTDNRTFCFDSALTEKVAPRDLVGATQERLSVEVYSDSSPSSVQPVPMSELEYYEVGSIGSAFHSDTSSLKLSWHKHLYSTKRVRSDPRQSGDLRMLLGGFKKENTSEEKSLTKPQDVALENRFDTNPTEQALPCSMKRFLQAELLEPIQHLTFEEISRLYTPLGQTMSNRAVLNSVPVPTSTTIMDLASESETDSTFTCSASENEQLSAIISSKVFERWEHAWNFYLPYSSYAPVFEDIACLPMIEPSRMYDMQSDIEEII